MELNGKTILISGASKGIGECIARTFAIHGAEKLLLLARDTKKLNELKYSIENNSGTKVEVFQVDIRKRDEIKEAINQIRQNKNKIEILVNNAGIMVESVLKMVRPEVVEDTFSTNVYGAIYLTQMTMSSMITERKGSIINISSIIGTHGNMGNSVYSASKSAIIGFTKSLSKEFAPFNIRVNAIAPGFINTEMVANIDKKVIDSIGMKHIGEPADVANLALFLASDMSAYITGQVIGVDGGMII